MDKLFKVETIRKTPNPQQLIWMAMHQDYSEDLVVEELGKVPNETRSGELAVKHLLAGGRGHFGVIEHPQISVNVGFYPHSMMQQLRTHRCGITFDCQSLRYTGKRIIDVVNGLRNVEEVFYLRPVGDYMDRQGKRYLYTAEMRQRDLEWCVKACQRYADNIAAGMSEEHARGTIPFDIRQHFVMSANMRTVMHLLDLRWKKDAQLEIQQFCSQLYERFEEWAPEIARWYRENRAQKARLSP